MDESERNWFISNAARGQGNRGCSVQNRRLGRSLPDKRKIRVAAGLRRTLCKSGGGPNGIGLTDVFTNLVFQGVVKTV
jgi:hypothetical protein